MKRPRVLKPEETRLWHKIARSTKPYSPQKMCALEAAVKAIEDKEAKTQTISLEHFPKSVDWLLDKKCDKQRNLEPHFDSIEMRKTPETKKKPQDSSKPQSRKPISSQIQDAAAHKRVRRGKIEIAATIDLHGFNQDEAKARLQSFIFDSFDKNLRCVLVVTGKGSNSQNEKEKHFDFFSSPRGIIRARFKNWLHEPQIRHLISGIATANPKHGGAGAFYVLIKANMKN